MTVYVKRLETDEWIDARVADVWDGTWPETIWIKMSEDTYLPGTIRDAQFAAQTASAEQWGCGLIDETEINHPDDAIVYGPFATQAEAKEYAEGLSIDPDEAVVFRLRRPKKIEEED